MKRIVVVGGGISGLSAAWSAWNKASELAGPGACDLLLIEREPEVGGKARTVARDGYMVETGPTGFLDNELVLERLVGLSGLERLPAQAAAARRYVVHGGKPREIQANPLKFATSGILSPRGMMRIACEPFVPKRTGGDESVWDFAARRIGPQAADRLVAPMALGVFAGDAKKLSLPSSFPKMALLEEKHGSLFKAMRTLKKQKKLSGGPAGPGGTLTSFAKGLQSFPCALADRAPFRVRTGASVDALVPTGTDPAWRVHLDGDAQSLPADAVIIAADLPRAARLLGGPAAPIAKKLGEISCPGVAVVALGYEGPRVGRVPTGFGALIPRDAGYRILGVLFDTHLFPGRSPDGQLLLRAMVGGATDPAAAELEELELAKLAHEELARLYGIATKPVFVEVTRWPEAIPQYELGHGRRVKGIEDALDELRQRHPGLHVTGNYLHGVAFGKAAASGWRTGARVAEELFGARARATDS